MNILSIRRVFPVFRGLFSSMILHFLTVIRIIFEVLLLIFN